MKAAKALVAREAVQLAVDVGLTELEVEGDSSLRYHGLCLPSFAVAEPH